jgi:hypothetical protein
VTTIETEHYNWQRHQPAPDPRYARLSPNLDAIGDELAKRWGMTDLGGYGWRPIRGGTAPSSHGFGAATDRRYFELGRARALSEVLPWLIRNSRALHLQAIHDYFGCRIWRAGRTANLEEAETKWWAPQPPNRTTGMGQSWAVYFHLETTRSGWPDGTPIPNRLVDGEPIPQPEPQPIPTPGGPFVHATIKRGDVNADVFAAQVIVRHRAGQTQVVADGQFGQQTENAIRNVQAFTGQTVDGIVGPKTWAVLDFLANS